MPCTKPEASVVTLRRTVEDAQATLDERLALLEQYERERDMLNEAYPDTTSAPTH